MENATQSKKKPSLKQLLALASLIASVLEEIFTSGQAQYWLQNKSKLRKKLFEVFEITAETYTEVRQQWQEFYQSAFGIEVDLSAVQVPEKPAEGNYRLLFIAKGLTTNKVYDSWKFPKWRYNDDLDKAVPTNKRTATESYAIWVLIGDEPDQEFLGKSTKTADPSMEIGMTLLERMIFESKYFAETGKHLDVKGVTFCSGSRYSDGSVPCVDLNADGKVCVSWYDLDDSNAKYGVRRAVSL
ncbi:MAG: hypothetical protein JWM20_594 [Patescibacteria group bacterium]|nr:hypothetical protein [Patescibacteria group bacterium]